MATMVATPARTLEQRRTALEKANTIRSYRAALKRDIYAGRRQLLDVLEDPMLDTMKVWELLSARRTFGRVKVAKAFRALGFSPSKTLGGLTERQRGELVKYLRSL